MAQTAPKPDGLWRGSLGLGATATSGNTDSAAFAINGDMVRQTDIDKTSGYVQSAYGRSETGGNTERTSDLARAGGKYDRDLNDRTFGFGLVELERNMLVDLELRSVIASGLGYHLIKRPGIMTFDVSTGPAYNRENYTTNTREFMEWLVAEESIHALTPTVSYRQRLSYYANLKESGEFRVVFDTGFVLKVTSRWSATITLNDRYQSNPLPGLKKNDLLFVTGLQYVFNP
jgi:putative salt-induced outer membrane protein YdiY